MRLPVLTGGENLTDAETRWATRMIVEAYTISGLSIREIAREVGRSYTWVGNRLVAAGVQLREPSTGVWDARRRNLVRNFTST